MEMERLTDLLKNIRKVRVAVVGDYCVDAYWIVDPSLSGVSNETGKTTLPVREQTYSLGGAGNIVSNLAALGVGSIRSVGVVCPDLFGKEMTRLLSATGANTSGMILQEGEWATPVYGKPYLRGEEQSRLDFGVCNRMRPVTEARVLDALENVVRSVDAVVVNQQLAQGLYSERVIQGINENASRNPQKVFLVDSRDRNHCFRGVAFRMNAHEAARVCGEAVPAEENVPLQDVVRYAQRIQGAGGRPAFISRGACGSLVCEKGQVQIIPGIPLPEEIDPVGAGDAAASALTAALAAGASPVEAAELGNLASAVTVTKLRRTGTASPEEILRLFSRIADP
jgi:rfaE bifunctional protein kinase chain/domain